MKKKFSKFLALLLSLAMILSLVPSVALAAGTITITVRVYDASSGSYYIIGSDTCNKASSGVQSDAYTIPYLSTFTNYNYGSVTKVVGNWYASGDKTEGATIYWSNNSSTGTMTYWVTQWKAPSSTGSGSSSTATENQGGGTKTTWTQTIVYHSNYPGGTDDTLTVTNTCGSYTIAASVTGTLKTYADCGFSVPTGYTLATRYWNTAADGTGTSYASTYTYNKANGTVHLYATYTSTSSGSTATAVTVTYKDGTSTIFTASALSGDTVYAPTYSKENYTFSGWDTDSSATTVVYSAGDPFTVDSNITLYAVLAANQVECTHQNLNYTSIDNMNHKVTCTNCSEEVKATESHTFANGECTLCGYQCTHDTYTEGKCTVCDLAHDHADEDINYTNNGDTHTGTCKVCGGTAVEEKAHVYTDGACVCGATETVAPTYTIEAQVIKVNDTDVTDPAAGNIQTVHAGDTITVRVIVVGGDDDSFGFYTAELDSLTWDSNLTLLSGPQTKWKNNDAKWALISDDSEDSSAITNRVLGTFTFKVNADLIDPAAQPTITLGKGTIETTTGSLKTDGVVTTLGTHVTLSVPVQNVTVTPANDLTYDSNPQNLIKEVEIPNDATITWTVTGPDGTKETIEGTSADPKIPTGTDAGDYEITYIVRQTDYEDVSGSFTKKDNNAVNIAQMPVTITAKNVDVTYGDTITMTATIDPDVKDANYTLKVYKTVDGEDVEVDITETVAPGTYTIKVEVEEGKNPNYNITLKNGTLTVKSGTIEASAKDVEVIYDGNEHSITVSKVPKTATVYYSTTTNDKTKESEWSTDNPTRINAGTTDVYWYATLDNYTATDVQKNTITVKPKPVTLTTSGSVELGSKLDVDNNLSYTVSYEVEDEDGTKTTITYDTSPLVDVKLACGDYNAATNTTIGETSYTITATVDEDANPNYSVTVVPGTLEVTTPEFKVEVKEYVNGYMLVLVGTNSDATFSFDQGGMYNVSKAKANYTVKGTEYAHVYAIVVVPSATDANAAWAQVNEDPTENYDAAIAEYCLALEKIYEQTNVQADMTKTIGTIKYTYDINGTGTVRANDVGIVEQVYAGNAEYLLGDGMVYALLSDVDWSKRVNSGDANAVRDAAWAELFPEQN